MNIYSIMRLDKEHIDEICEDIVNQYRNGVADCALFSLTLVPEGNPVMDKAGELMQTYDLFRDRLSEYGVECGMLVQASIGHGYVLNEMFPFTQYVNFSDGEKENVCCPYDENLRNHFRQVMKTLASHKPKLIMVDDDFRLMSRPGRGCACELHMKEFNRRAETQLTLEELRESIKADARHKEIFIETQGDSMIGLAKAMREGIDAVDPSVPGAFCACGDDCEFAEDIAKILAGKGNPSIVRVNNGRYTPLGGHEFTYSMLRAAKQVTILRDKVDILLAETDTCPQNRYSTGAQFLHSHFTGTLLEGTKGAKHWITRASFEPDSGTAYRKILSKNRGFYEAVAELAPQLEPVGCRIPLSSKRNFYFDKDNVYDIPDDYCWATHALERLGLPLYFSDKSGGAVFMTGTIDKNYTDDEMLEFFKGTLFLASDSLKALNERGFLKYTGVKAEEWTGENISGEIIYLTGNNCQKQKNALKLVPINEKVKEESTVYHLKNGKTKQPLFPGVTVFKNELGGTVVSFCGVPKTLFSYTEGFSFLNESRKKQLAALLKKTGNLPVYYTGDADLYLRAAYYNNELFCAFFNLNFDVLEEIPLYVEKKVTKIEMLGADGKRIPCDFEPDGDKITVKTQILPMNPVILFIS